MVSNERSYAGGEITDPEIVEKLPQPYRHLLQQVNGCILFNGGLHIRGAVVSPPWHSLRVAWFGDIALHRLFPAIQQQDVPFAQDCFGDQFVLRDGVVHRLQAEPGDIENLAMDLEAFLLRAQEAPGEFLSLHPLQQFRTAGGELKPGELLSVYPPFCTKESAVGVSLRAISASDRIGFFGRLCEADFPLARRYKSRDQGLEIEVTVGALLTRRIGSLCLPAVNSSRTMASLRRRDDNSRSKVHKVRKDSSVISSP